MVSAPRLVLAFPSQGGERQVPRNESLDSTGVTLSVWCSRNNAEIFREKKWTLFPRGSPLLVNKHPFYIAVYRFLINVHYTELEQQFACLEV